MDGLLAYLTEHCCQGAACEISPARKTGKKKTVCASAC